MVNNNLYINQDTTLYFGFNGKRSDYYNAFIVRDGIDDFHAISNINHQIDFIEPTGGGISYISNNDVTQYTISFIVAASELNTTAYNSFKSWLHSGSTGLLYFDDNVFWGYRAIITNSEEIAHYVYNNQHTVELEVEFKTVGIAMQSAVTNPSLIPQQWRIPEKISNDQLYILDNQSYLDQTICNDLFIPELEYTDNHILVPHVCDGGYFFACDIPVDRNIYGIKITINDNILIDYEWIWNAQALNTQKDQAKLYYDSSTGLLSLNAMELIDHNICVDDKNDLVTTQLATNQGIYFAPTFAPQEIILKPLSTQTVSVQITDKNYYGLLANQYNNMFVAQGCNNDWRPLYGIDYYNQSNDPTKTEYFNYTYSCTGHMWHTDTILGIAPSNGYYNITLSSKSQMNSTIAAGNLANYISTIGNYDIITIETYNQKHQLTTICPLRITINKYKR